MYVQLSIIIMNCIVPRRPGTTCTRYLPSLPVLRHIEGLGTQLVPGTEGPVEYCEPLIGQIITALVTRFIHYYIYV